MGVAERFSAFHDNILLSQKQLDDGAARRRSVVQALNVHYRATTSETDNSMFVGSRGKSTSIRPPRDIDVLYTLPDHVYDRFQQRAGNKQSQLLQEVKNVLQLAFSTTSYIKGDGPIVKVPFSTFNVELIPAFRLQDGKYRVCFTDNGGSYKTADYLAEHDRVKVSNDASNGQTRELVRMMKKWQEYCSVPIKSFWIELLAVEFLANWEHRCKSRIYHDFMVRDFLKHLKSKRSSFVLAPGTFDFIWLGDAWYSKAETAYDRAMKACNHEAIDVGAAGDEWRKIFGNDMPRIA